MRSALLAPDPVIVTQAASFIGGSDLCCQHPNLLWVENKRHRAVCNAVM